ncbi:hypothetical protein D3Z50_06075 [Clostridiaceae bacterium]|nr:hypothetical protein [Clostridiaceae bacterium]
MGWYLLACEPGREERLKDSCKKRLPEPVLEDAFLFSYERMKKYLGQWHVDTCRMFPGYVFLQSGCPELLQEAVSHYLRFFGALDSGQRLVSVETEVERRIRSLCGEHRHMALSHGSLLDGRFIAEEGPLAGRESLIAKVDLHKRVAVLDLRLMEGGRPVWAGIAFK